MLSRVGGFFVSRKRSRAKNNGSNADVPTEQSVTHAGDQKTREPLSLGSTGQVVHKSNSPVVGKRMERPDAQESPSVHSISSLTTSPTLDATDATLSQKDLLDQQVTSPKSNFSSPAKPSGPRVSQNSRIATQSEADASPHLRVNRPKDSLDVLKDSWDSSVKLDPIGSRLANARPSWDGYANTQTTTPQRSKGAWAFLKRSVPQPWRSRAEEPGDRLVRAGSKHREEGSEPGVRLSEESREKLLAGIGGLVGSAGDPEAEERRRLGRPQQPTAEERLARLEAQCRDLEAAWGMERRAERTASLGSTSVGTWGVERRAERTASLGSTSGDAIEGMAERRPSKGVHSSFLKNKRIRQSASDPRESPDEPWQEIAPSAKADSSPSSSPSGSPQHKIPRGFKRTESFTAAAL